MNDTFIRVRSFQLRGEAELCRMLLEREGINAYIDGEHFCGVNWLWTNAGGGIKIFVSQTDGARAKELVGEQTFAEEGSHSLIKLVAFCVLVGYPMFWLLSNLIIGPI